MENSKNEILQDIRTLISEIRERTELLESKLAQLEGETGTQAQDAVDIWDDDLEFIQPESVEIIKDAETPEAMETAEPEEILKPEDKAEQVDIPVEEKPVQVGFRNTEEKVKHMEAPMGLFEEDEETAVAVARKKPGKKSVLDTLENKEAWRTDVSGAAVKDVRSAISLNDRILFIRSLFNEDAVAFNDMLDTINSSSSFDEAVENIKAEHPDWKYESETVYRLMMAVRRRFR